MSLHGAVQRVGTTGVHNVVLNVMVDGLLFALGLLHDVGKLVVFDRLGELQKTLRRDVNMPHHIMGQVLKILHEPLGGIAALQWGLGPDTAHAIATHHRSPVPEVLDRRGELLYLAERVDLCYNRGRWELPFDQWWLDGALNVDRPGVEAALAAMSPLADERL